MYSVCVCVCLLQGRVWLIDLNPFGEVTDSLLFTWEELTSSGEISQQQVSHHDTRPCCKLIFCIVTLVQKTGYVLPLHVQDGPAFRYTTSEVTVQPSPCLSYRIPRDFVDLSAGEDAYKLIDFLKLVGVQNLLSVFIALVTSYLSTSNLKAVILQIFIIPNFILDYIYGCYLIAIVIKCIYTH